MGHFHSNVRTHSLFPWGNNESLTVDCWWLVYMCMDKYGFPQTMTLNVSESFLICGFMFQRLGLRLLTRFMFQGLMFERLDLPEAWCSRDSVRDGAGPFSILYFRSSWLDLGRGGLMFQRLRLRRGWTFRHLPHPSYGLHFEAALKIQFSSNYFYIKVHHVDGETSLEYLSFPIFNSLT